MILLPWRARVARVVAATTSFSSPVRVQASDADGVTQPNTGLGDVTLPPPHLIPPSAAASMGHQRDKDDSEAGAGGDDGTAEGGKESRRGSGASASGHDSTSNPNHSNTATHQDGEAAAAAAAAAAEAEAARLTTVLYGCHEDEFVRTHKAVMELDSEQSFVVAHQVQLRMGEEQWYQVLCSYDDIKNDELLRIGCESYTHTYSLAEGVDYVRHQDILPLAPDSADFEHDLWKQLFHNTLTPGPERVAVCKQRPDTLMDADRHGLETCTIWCSEAFGITVHVLPIMVSATMNRHALTYKVCVLRGGGERDGGSRVALSLFLKPLPGKERSASSSSLPTHATRPLQVFVSYSGNSSVRLVQRTWIIHSGDGARSELTG